MQFFRGGTAVMNQGYGRDDLNRLSGTTASLAGGGALRSVGYQLDSLDRRYQADWNDGTSWSYGYNERSEVTSTEVATINARPIMSAAAAALVPRWPWLASGTFVCSAQRFLGKICCPHLYCHTSRKSASTVRFCCLH